MIKQIEWKNDILTLLDQRLLPITEKYIECTKYDQIIDAIKTLAVRGAPLIGVSAGMGIVVAAKETDKKGEELRQYVIEAEKKLRAVNKKKERAEKLNQEKDEKYKIDD